MITLRQLEVFAEVVRCDGSVTQAAARLFVSQPSVSDTLRALEKSLDIRLFSGRGKARALGPAGEIYWGYTQQIMGLIDEAAQAVADLADTPRGRLSVVAVPTAGEHLVPGVLNRFVKEYPGVNITLLVANRADATEALRDGSADLAIMGRPPASLDAADQIFLDNRLVLVCASSHELAGKSPELAEIASRTFLLREQGSGTRAAIDQLFASEGLELNDTMVLGSNHAVLAAVREGLGLAIIPEIVAASKIRSGEIVELRVAPFPILRDWRMVWLRTRTPSSPANAFMSMMTGEMRSRTTNDPESSVER